jgi:hypothetical protein
MPDIPIPVPAVQARTPWFSKFAECLLATIAVFDLSWMLIQLLPEEVHLPFDRSAFVIILLGLLILGPTLGLAYSLFWHFREKRQAINSGKLHAWFRAILRYWLAFSISIYGFGKIFRTQFSPSFTRSDTPVGQLNGFELTWNYFGHSYLFAVLIASLQIGGSALLLFRRTTLLGAAILLPVMTNILLINIFYHIAAGAFLNSVLFTLGLIYLLYLRRAEWIRLFLHSVDSLPAVGPGWLKQIARLLAMGGAAAVILSVVNENPDSPLQGKWTVDWLIRNRDTVAANAWLTDSVAWRSVYIEKFNKVSFCPNPYIYDNARSLDADYDFDSAKHEMRLYFMKSNGKSSDTAIEAVSHYDGNHMNWEGLLGGDTVRLRLSRVRD